METPWWKKAVIYQIYPRSYADANGDGVGDLAGILTKLDYLKTLSIDAIWLSPVYRSPQDDNGYDISDYEDIDPLFGTLADMDRLIEEAGKRGIGIIMDLVLNHSSDEHRWFLEAKKSRDNPYHDYYIWRDGVKGCPPNDMRASFGGSAWEWVEEVGQYYFHQFSRKQPDLNWDNPRVRQELYAMIRFWADRGVRGFRLDVVDHLGKRPNEFITTDGPRLHEFLREMRREAFCAPDLVTVGEAWSVTPEKAMLYSNPDGSELSMVFGFEHMTLDQDPQGDKWSLVPLDFVALKKVFARWQTALRGRGWNSLFWENHDIPRSVSRLGDEGKYRVESARMLAIALHGMQGTPYVYQGEELGMTNAHYALSEYRDIEILNMVKEKRAQGLADADILPAVWAKGRDNARTPMQWSAEKNAGFSEAEPWLRVNPNYVEINAASQVGDPDSVFACYQTLIRLRHELPILTEGDFTLLLEDDPRLFAYRRRWEGQELLVVANFSGESCPDPLAGEEDSKLLLSSWTQPGEAGTLRPYEARLILKGAAL